VVGPSGLDKTALAETFLILSDAAWRHIPRRESPRGVSVGIEIELGCAMLYEVRIGGEVQDDLEVHCPYVDADLIGADQFGIVVGAALRGLLKDVAVILNIDWKTVRSPSPKPLVKQMRLQPDASNFVPYLYTITRGNVPESLVEALRYVFPGVNNIWFEEEGGRLLLKFTTSSGVELDQTNAPASVLKTLIVETVLHTNPMLVVIDEFENSLHPEAQQFLMDEFRSRGVYAVLMTPLHGAAGLREDPQRGRPPEPRKRGDKGAQARQGGRREA